jgi:two-component system alkaline phosphatase synthesis response regulator PhoP
MHKMQKILVIEDEESILMALEDNLRLEGYDVACAVDGEQGLSMAREQKFDLLILDIMLPKMDGFEVCKHLRRDEINTPILMLTAKSQEIDKVLGLELGADDYVTKPFSPRELLARIRALLRRTQQFQQDMESYHFGDIEVDFNKYEVKKGGRLIYLTALEFSLLHFLIKNKGQVVNRDAILDEVWGDDVFVQPRTVDKHIAELRKKIEGDPSSPNFILGVRGIGYKFQE